MKIIQTHQLKIASDVEGLIAQIRNARQPAVLSPDYIEYLRKKTPEQLSELLRMTQEDKPMASVSPAAAQSPLPEEIADLGATPANDTFVRYTRYIWEKKGNLSRQLQGGLEMNANHDSLPEGWHYIHVGSEEWVSSLGFEYGRVGRVCEVTIDDLPEGFYYLNDLDTVFPGKSPDSGMLISKQSIIPPQCLKITRCLSTRQMQKEYPQYGEEGSNAGPP